MRGLALIGSSTALRFRQDTPHPEQRGRLPAMLAAISDPAGNLIAVHRTFLCRDGLAKADVEPQKATLGHYWGGAVRLDQAGFEIVVGEGIETSGAAGLLMGLPAWSAVSAGNLARGLMLPAIVRRVVIAVDRDPSGEQAARAAGSRWAAEGRRVRYWMPNTVGRDACDVLAARNTADV
jgi:putative DNA primase/helicase